MLPLHLAPVDPPTAAPVPGHLAPYAAEVAALRGIGHEFHQRRWSLGTSSNYSAVVRHDPLELVVTASGKDKGALTNEDFVLIGGDGRPTISGQPKSSAETLLHVVLAKLPGCGAVLHTHSVWGTLLSDWFADQGQLEIEGYEMLKGLEGIATHETSTVVRIFDNTQDIPDLARRVNQWLDGGPLHPPHAFLIRRHGLYTWGCDLATARRHVEILEFLFECVARDIMFRGDATRFSAVTQS